MTASAEDPGVFIRSAASRGAMGGVADSTGPMTAAMRRAGFELLVVETVGAGQNDVMVRKFASPVVLVMMPGAGDDLQLDKAGITEIADVFVINKADLPGVDLVFEAVQHRLFAAAGEAHVQVTREDVGQVWIGAAKQEQGLIRRNQPHSVSVRDVRLIVWLPSGGCRMTDATEYLLSIRRRISNTRPGSAGASSLRSSRSSSWWHSSIVTVAACRSCSSRPMISSALARAVVVSMLLTPSFWNYRAMPAVWRRPVRDGTRTAIPASVS